MTAKKNLCWCYFLLLYKTHFLFEGKLNPARHKSGHQSFIEFFLECVVLAGPMPPTP